MKRVIVFFLLLFLNLMLEMPRHVIPKSYAQMGTSSGIAVYIPIDDKKVEEGDIVTLSDGSYELSKIPYDPNIFGVVVEQPALAFETNSPDSYPVVTSGKVLLTVTTINGEIRKGDIITSSPIAGAGQRADEAGTIVGTALEDFGYESGEKFGKVLVVLNIGYRDISIHSTIEDAGLEVKTLPSLGLSVARYGFAGIILLVSFVIGIGYFGKLSRIGVEPVGRSPPGGKVVFIAMFMDVVIALSILVGGVLLAYLVLGI